MASSTGVFFSPYVGIYSSTKNLVDIYSRTLSIENNNKIDIISCRPFGVTTSMMKMKKASFMITPRDCALSTLADLGKTHTTFSGFDHKVAGSFVSQMSHQAVCDYFGKEFKKR